MRMRVGSSKSFNAEVLCESTDKKWRAVVRYQWFSVLRLSVVEAKYRQGTSPYLVWVEAQRIARRRPSRGKQQNLTNWSFNEGQTVCCAMVRRMREAQLKRRKLMMAAVKQ